MEKQLETRLELYKSGVTADMLKNGGEALGKGAGSASKSASRLSKEQIKSYVTTKLMVNRE